VDNFQFVAEDDPFGVRYGNDLREFFGLAAAYVIAWMSVASDLFERSNDLISGPFSQTSQFFNA